MLIISWEIRPMEIKFSELKHLWISLLSSFDPMNNIPNHEGNSKNIPHIDRVFSVIYILLQPIELEGY